ncbi:MAG: LuxR family transcriptional regulator, partial [Nocardia sp.]|nr:LuxR family transcriptional regulator [Nocardia sp.]
MGAAARDPTPVLGTLPGAREVLRTLDSDTPHPAVCLVRGRCGTGKSTLLAQIREVFARRGIRCRDDIGAALDSPDDAAALIIDDAQALDRRQLEQLCATVESRSAPLIIATRPLPHDEALAAVAAAVARRGRVLDLRTLGTTDITLFARELGVRVPNRLADHIHRRTGGIPAGVVAALSAVRTTHADAGQAPVDRAIDAWARALLDKFPPHLLEILTVATAGPGLDPAELTRVLDLDIATAIGRIDQARSCAVITDADLVLEPAIPHLRPRIGEQRFLALGRRLLTVRLAAGLLDASTAIHLAESGVRDERLVEYLCAAAENASANKNAAGEANRYYRAAVAAGCPPERITVPWAYAAVADGDDAQALRLAEPILALADPTAEDWADAVRICAGAWARAGLIERARRLYSRLGAEYTEADRANAATVFTLAGAVDEAAHARTPAARADTRGARLATALAQTIGTEPADGASAAAATLINVARTAIPTDRTLPCPPALPAALLCLSIGEAHRAAEWLRDADPRDPRIRILRAWTAMFSGDEPGAARDMTAVDTADLAPRERLLAHGALVGLARRAGDHGALARAWRTACPTVDQVDADLTAVLPIGELRLAGIRLGEQDRIAG